jgi:uncharacterized membrane protein YphA (DoxX/SURF4 family)
MKKTKITYWIITGLFLAFMLMSGISEIFLKDAAKYITDLSLPAYLNPFLGVAKLLGIIAILIPGFHRLKEWAYAGFVIDLVGATYCMIASGYSIEKWWSMLIWVALVFVSYALYQKKQRETVA